MSLINVSTSDNHIVKIPRDIVNQVGVLNDLVQLQQDTTDDPITLANVDAKTMEKVVEYCVHHKDDPIIEKNKYDVLSRSDDIDEWDLNFMHVDTNTLLHLLLASNYLDIQPLMDLGCKMLANMIRGKDSGQTRQIFNLTDDYTDEEKEQIRKENEWAE
ncbi:hypothetical protein H4R99_007335 [Coemansia sp. RSA 1722]|nr:hypothetical protein IWW45_005246 [Coemansia sp. RSA 485]KAJ2589810.1 hypothetical protein H4R99_007335 [Coemansia sp. RSA 1722]KAJ2600813.1 hypothetical protein GGF39_001577 [Coemansia sp. RSA 1721]